MSSRENSAAATDLTPESPLKRRSRPSFAPAENESSTPFEYLVQALTSTTPVPLIPAKGR